MSALPHLTRGAVQVATIGLGIVLGAVLINWFTNKGLIDTSGQALPG